MIKLCEKAVSGLFLLIMIWICSVVLFFNSLSIPDWVRKSFLVPNLVLLPLGFLIMVVVTNIVGGKRIHAFKIAIIIFIVQSAVSYTYFFTTGWDAGTVMEKAFEAAYNGFFEIPEGYYSYYVNNILIHCIEYLVAKSLIFIGIKSEFVAVTILMFIQCMLSSITSVLIYDITEMLMPNNKVASNISFILYILIISTSPWIPIIYTDSMSLIVPSLMIWLYFRARKGKGNMVSMILFATIISFIGMAGYRLKATAFITFIAIIVQEVYFLIKDVCEGGLSKIKGYLIKIAIAVAMVFISNYLFVALYSACGVQLDSDEKCPFTHYLMMGFNDAEAGTFNFPDANETLSRTSYEARYEHDLSEAKKRIKSLLPWDIFRFEARKTLVNYNDGTFGYGIEGDFYNDYREDRVPALSSLFKEVFWDSGKIYPYFAILLQGLWLVVLFGGIFFSFYKSSGEEILIKVTLIGVFLFLSLFEARARYLFIYTPVYIVAAAVGLERIRTMIKREG